MGGNGRARWAAATTAQSLTTQTYGAGVAALCAGLAAGVLAAQSFLHAATLLVGLGWLNAALAEPRTAAVRQWAVGLLAALALGALAWRLAGLTGLAVAACVWRVGSEARWWVRDLNQVGAPDGALAGLGPWAIAVGGIGLALAGRLESLAGLALPSLPPAIGIGLAVLGAACALIWVAGRVVQHRLGEPPSLRDGRLVLMALLWVSTFGFAADAAAGLAALACCRLALTAEARWRRLGVQSLEHRQRNPSPISLGSML